MFPRDTGMQCGPDYRGGRPGWGGNDQCDEQCLPRRRMQPQWTGRSQNQRAWNYQDPFYGPPRGSQQYRPPGPCRNRPMAERENPYMEPYDMHANPSYPLPRVPSYDRFDPLFVNESGGGQCGDSDNDQSMAGDWAGWSESSWSSSKRDGGSCQDWSTMRDGTNPFSSGYPDSDWSNSLFGNISRFPSAGCPNPQVHQGYTKGCSLKHTDPPLGLLTRFMNMIRPPVPKCPLKPQTSKAPSQKTAAGATNSCFSPVGSTKHPEGHFNSLDDLWNPRKIRRWGCVNNWDQHKESLWKQVIENKLGGCGPAGRSIESKVHEAIDALHQEGAECIAFRMFYGILKRNEDVYLNPYMQLMTDDEFLKLIVALNNFYFEDKDKQREFLNHPPPTWIEQIMQKETLAILDPGSRAPSIVRRFWEALLDWYNHKLVEKGDPSAACGADRTASQSSFGNF